MHLKVIYTYIIHMTCLNRNIYLIKVKKKVLQVLYQKTRIRGTKHTFSRSLRILVVRGWIYSINETATLFQRLSLGAYLSRSKDITFKVLFICNETSSDVDIDVRRQARCERYIRDLVNGVDFFFFRQIVEEDSTVFSWAYQQESGEKSDCGERGNWLVGNV